MGRNGGRGNLPLAIFTSSPPPKIASLDDLEDFASRLALLIS